MATASLPHRWKYDAFVSFRGEDIRKSFIDHLFKDFRQKGIRVFRDDNELPKGEEISPQLYKAIEESRFLIVIFSKNYASSSWCLRELVKILDCKRIEEQKHEVLPIFYDVKPDTVRKQKRSYAEAFSEHESLNRTEEPILLVLDGVDHREQLEALAGSPNWFFQGSLIIFTGKDKQLLKSHKVETYDMEFLDADESLELFSLYAFHSEHPREDLKVLAYQIVEFLSGHPLALKVLGCTLYDKGVHVWESQLERLQTYPSACEEINNSSANLN